MKTFIANKLNDSQINTSIKQAVENEAIEYFTNLTLNEITRENSKPSNYSTQNVKNNFELPPINNHSNYDNSFSKAKDDDNNLKSKNKNENSITQNKEKPVDLYNRITQMKVMLEQEEISKARIDQIAKKHQ